MKSSTTATCVGMLVAAFVNMLCLSSAAEATTEERPGFLRVDPSANIRSSEKGRFVSGSDGAVNRALMTSSDDLTMQTSMCSNGFPGIQTGDVCCAMECGQCGEMNCDDAPGGAEACCTDRILNTGSPCSDVDEAPCFIVDGEATPNPTMMPTMAMSICSNGFLGIQTGDVCCAMECGLCGGMNCGDAPGGAESCCTARILDAGSPCSDLGEAPCFIVEDEPTSTPTMMPTMAISTCSNGLPGIQTGDVCCAMECGLCGGMNCDDAPGGAEACCTDRILNTGSPCSNVDEAPCFIVDGEPTPNPTMMSTMAMSTCSNGFSGIQTGDVCCAMECGLCGGMNCGDAPGGAESCCTARIVTTGNPCSDVDEAPCFIVEDEPTPTPTLMPTMAVSTCSNGFPGIQTGDVCCAMECGVCGGMDCGDAPGGAESCCTARILNTGSPCSDVDEAPCFIVDGEPTPNPTMMPTMAMSACSNGLPGIQAGDVCCAMECGLCGGMDCGDAPGGAESCCTARILNTGSPCSDVNEAPCFIVDGEPTPNPTMAPTMTMSTCSNGLPGIQAGDVCCALECGLCGGMNCSDAPGGQDSCCEARILNVGSPCALTGEAPCYIS